MTVGRAFSPAFDMAWEAVWPAQRGVLSALLCFGSVAVMDADRELIATVRLQSAWQEKVALNAVLDGIRDADFERFTDGLAQLDMVLFGWRKAMCAIVRLDPDPPRRFREAMLGEWVRNGDYIREQSGDDLLLVGALRALLPRYAGPALRVWRGDSAWNRRRRTYGLSWSLDRDAAEGFARGMWQTFSGGSVLLEADAPPDAIVCTIAAEQDEYGEDEILVDRRRLKGVRVIARYDQRPVRALA